MEPEGHYRQKHAGSTTLGILAPGVAKAAAGGVFHLSVAGFAFIEADDTKARWFAALLVVGAFVEMAHTVATAASQERRKADIAKNKRAGAARRSTEKGAAADTRGNIESLETPVARDPLQTHANIFYATLILGVAGLAAALYGLSQNVYFCTLGGTIVAAVGFTGLACALISAENIVEGPNEDARSYPDGSRSEHSARSV